MGTHSCWCSICRAVLSLSQKRKLAEKFKNLKKNSTFLEETPNFKKNSKFGTKRLFWWPSQLRKYFFFGLDRCWNNMSTLSSGFAQLSAKSILVKIPSHVRRGEEAVKCSGPTTRYLGLKSLYARVGKKKVWHPTLLPTEGSFFPTLAYRDFSPKFLVA